MFVIKRITLPRSQNSTILLQNKLFSAAISEMKNPVVTVTQGKLRGAVKKLLDKSLYYSFKGIPYAQPPVGQLRFKAPLPAKPWSGILNALNHGPICPQFDIYTSSTLESKEDCLFLNVYTKSLESSSKLPVMVFIHGGAFMSGSGNSESYGPEYICQKDVILVTINYRLEALGFLCLDTEDVPGNAGMKDQVLALKWVKENIDKFGGDPNNVTLIGESAGAASAMYHMFSSMSKDLFHKVIAQSGTCIQDWSIGSCPKERAFHAGKLLGNTTDNPDELAEFFRSLPAINLLKITLKTRTTDEVNRGLPMYFVPVIEKEFKNTDNFLTEDPVSLLQAQKVAKVPVIIGYNSIEGLTLLNDQLKKADILNRNPSYLLPKEIVQNIAKNKLSKLGDALKTFYFGSRNMSEETLLEIVDMQTDRQFSYNCHRFCHFYSKFNEPTYMYKFDLETDLNLVKKMSGHEALKGACHTEELLYLFSSAVTRVMYEKQQIIRHAVENMTRLWTDFAKTGNPTPDSSIVTWKPYTPSGGEYLLIANEIKSCAHADHERIAFWNKMYAEAGLPSIAQ